LAWASLARVPSRTTLSRGWNRMLERLFAPLLISPDAAHCGVFPRAPTEITLVAQRWRLVA
jgi:hypothetical protein